MLDGGIGKSNKTGMAQKVSTGANVSEIAILLTSG